MTTLFPVLLAGGAGSRLQPLSTPEYPKQFLVLSGKQESLLQSTAREALTLAPANRVITVTTAAHAHTVREQLAEVAHEMTTHILIEPEGKGTATAAAVANIYAQQQAEDAALWLLPCDHVREAPLKLADYLEAAHATAATDKVLLFGVRPTSPDSGFGYILPQAEGCLTFTEKPKEETANPLIAQGSYWNSGMFVFSAATLANMLRAHDPERLAWCEQAVQHAQNGDLSPVAYANMTAGAIDTVLMEKVDNLLLQPLADGWADIGTWPRLLQWWKHHASEVTEWMFTEGRRVKRMPETTLHAPTACFEDHEHRVVDAEDENWV